MMYPNETTRILLTKTTSLTLRLEQSDNVIVTDGSDNVADNAALSLQQFGANLGDTSARTGAAEALDDTGKFNLLTLVLYRS